MKIVNSLKVAFGIGILLFVSCAATAEDPNPGSGRLEFWVGGVPMIIPPPSLDLMEVGERQRGFMSAFADDDGRLVAAFTIDGEIPGLDSFGSKFDVSRYALVSVLELDEFKPMGREEFQEIISQMDGLYADSLEEKKEESEEKLNRLIQSYTGVKVPFELGAPILLGTLFSKQDLYGSGVIFPMKIGEESRVTASASMLLRAKERLIFLHLFTTFENEETLEWLRVTAENWGDSILVAN